MSMKNVQALRKQWGLRQTQLAGAIGVLPSTVAAWDEHGVDGVEYARIVGMLTRPFLNDSGGVSKGCIYCHGDLDGSDEHVLLSSLGGRLLSKYISCLDCNNRLGSGPHRALLSPLHPLLLMADARDGRGRVHAPLSGGTDSQGIATQMWSGGEIRLKGPRVERRPRPDGREDVTVYANSPAEAMEIAAGMARRKGTTFEIVDATHTIDPPPPWSFAPTGIGGGDDFRAIASMVLALLAHGVGTEVVNMDAGVEEVRRYINGDSELPCVWWALGVDLDLPDWALPQADPGLRNVVAVSADPASGLVIGRVVLLGHLAFEVVLSRGWTGERVAFAYAVEPTTGSEHGPHHLDSRWSATASAQAEMDLDLVRDALSDVYRVVSERHERHVRAANAERVSAQAVAEVLGGLREGDLIEPHHLQDLAATAAELHMALGRQSPLVRRQPVERIVRGLEARSRLSPSKRRRRPKA